MNISEMHTAFKLEIDKSEGLELPAFEQEEIDKWLNNAIRKFVKTRYKEFEQSQKRMDDLSALVREESLSVVPIIRKPNTVVAIFPKRVDSADSNIDDWDYWFTISEAVDIGYLKLGESYTARVTSLPADDWGTIGAYYYFIDSLTQLTTAYGITEGTVTDSASGTNTEGQLTYDSVVYYSGMVFKYSNAETTYNTLSTPVVYEKPHIRRTSITEVTADNFEAKYVDPYSEHVLHYEQAEPLRVLYNDIVELTTDGEYGVINYYLRYIKRPERVNIEVDASIAGADNQIEEGLYYHVINAGTSITYNSVVYLKDTYFYGVYGENTFTPLAAETIELLQSDCELSEHTHDEIVKLAASMALENIEQPRYQSHMNEVATME